MNKDILLKKFQEYRTKMETQAYLRSLIHWDSATIAPKSPESIAYRAKIIAELSGEKFDFQTNPENIKLLEDIMSAEGIDDYLKKSAETYLKEIDLFRCLPREFYVESVRYQNLTSKMWEEARRKSDYEIFRPYLEKLMDYRLKTLEYRGFTGEPYDAFLNDFEEGMDMKQYDAFFDLVKKELVPFVKKIETEGRPVDDSVLFLHYPEEKQREFIRYIMEIYYYDFEKGAMSTTVHPFACPMCPGDVRIAIKFVEDFLPSAMFSASHELGHAVTHLQVNENIQGMNIGTSPSSGISESMSRFYENYIARSFSFWKLCYGKLQEIFPKNLGNVELKDFYRIINRVTPQPIRIEADELTYPLHILFRYEIEKELLSGRLSTKDVPRVWNDKCEEYIGVRPENDRDGCLQDIHWAGPRGFGTFPAYAIGSAYGAQYLHAMKKDFDVDKAVEQNRLDQVNTWLKEHINGIGCMMSPRELLIHGTGEPLNPQYYVDGLIQKFSEIYF